MGSLQVIGGQNWVSKVKIGMEHRIKMKRLTDEKKHPITIHLSTSKKMQPPRKPTKRRIDESLFNDVFRKLQEKIPVLNSQDLTLELLKCYENAKLERRVRISKEWFDSELYHEQKQLKQAYAKSGPQDRIIPKMFEKQCRQKKIFSERKRKKTFKSGQNRPNYVLANS